jgi:hypothetical protein
LQLNQHAVLSNAPIKASEAFADLELAFATVIQKWNTATNQPEHDLLANQAHWKVLNPTESSDQNKIRNPMTSLENSRVAMAVGVILIIPLHQPSELAIPTGASSR